MTEIHKILHVDDDQGILAVSKMVLEVMGEFELVQSSSGAEALEAVLHFKPELILLDAMMPDMSGLETMLALKELPEAANIPVIFMTAKAQPSELKEFEDAGAIGTITKPFDPITLPNQIRSVWKSR